jgi:hypothetical protein
MANYCLEQGNNSIVSVVNTFKCNSISTTRMKNISEMTLSKSPYTLDCLKITALSMPLQRDTSSES